MKALFLILLMLFYFSLKSFLMSKKHILMLLLSLELMGLIILVMMISLICVYENDFSMIMYYMVVLVCESVLGVSLLTLLVRFVGNDYMKSMSLILC